jgi:hypothetical protein
LLLFYPWSATQSDPFSLLANEDAYLLSGSVNFQSRYESVRTVFEQNRKQYEFNDRLDWDGVQRTAKELLEANEELLRLSTRDPVQTHTLQEPDEPERYDFGQDLGVSAATSAVTRNSIPVVRMSDDRFREECQHLILNQLRYLYHILHLYRYSCGKPFFEFLTEGAGTGKSVALQVIAEYLNRLFGGRVGVDPSSLKVLLVAFTGSAAFNIHGTTIHHALRIPFACKLLPYKRLSGEERSKMRDMFFDLVCLMIDEISMTGATLLYYIHRRLQDILENNQPFGGVHVLACGDLYQLKHVSDGYCFRGVEIQDSSGQSIFVSNIWIDLFEMYELTKILRQEHGLPFTEALNRLRT